MRESAFVKYPALLKRRISSGSGVDRYGILSLIVMACPFFCWGEHWYPPEPGGKWAGLITVCFIYNSYVFSTDFIILYRSGRQKSKIRQQFCHVERNGRIGPGKQSAEGSLAIIFVWLNRSLKGAGLAAPFCCRKVSRFPPSASACSPWNLVWRRSRGRRERHRGHRRNP